MRDEVGVDGEECILDLQTSDFLQYGLYLLANSSLTLMTFAPVSSMTVDPRLTSFKLSEAVSGSLAMTRNSWVQTIGAR